MKEEFFQSAFRKTLYESLEPLLAVGDRYLEVYKRDRAHQAYRNQGRTPHRAFLHLLNETSKSEEVGHLSREIAEKVNRLPKEAVA